MSPEEMRKLFNKHRDAELARDYDGSLEAFVEDRFLETQVRGPRSEGRDAVRRTTRRATSRRS
jgi:hypothetical protein